MNFNKYKTINKNKINKYINSSHKKFLKII